MATTFLLRFSAHLVERLLQDERLEIVAGGEEATIHWLADHLGRVQNVSLVSEVCKALLAAPSVVELYADNEEIKDLVVDLSPAAARG